MTIIIIGCDNNGNELITSEREEYDIILEITDAETEEGLEEAVLELQNKDGKTIVAEEKSEKGLYEFSQVKLERETDFNVYIMKNNYESKKIKLFAEDDVISKVDDNAVSLNQLNLSSPETFDFNLKGDSSTGVLSFNIKNILDKDGNVFTGDLIGENKSLKIDYTNSKIKFYWYCSNSGYLHRATLFFDDIGFSDQNFDKWKEKEFSSSKKFSDTTYEKDGMSYIKDEWFEFINMIHSFDQYEIILNLEYGGEQIEITSDRLTYPMEYFEEFPVESAARAIVGTVTDENGNPIEGAEVVINTETELQNWHSSPMITDENGNYGGSEYRLASEGAHSLTVNQYVEKNISLGVPAENILDGNAQPTLEPKVIDFELE